MKNILLIGGSHGIGLALAGILQQENLFVASRTSENLVGKRVHHLTFDAATDTIDLSTLPEMLDGFVFLPGTINLRPFKNIKPESFDEEIKANFTDMIRVLQSILPKLLAAENASIVLFSSIAATKGMPFHTAIAAAKGAVEGFAKSFAAEYAPKIRMNVIAPSLTDTPLAEKFLNSDIKQQKSNERHPLKRFGKPEDMAQMAAFLLTDKSGWITGQVFHVDGGLSNLIINS